MIRFSSRLYPFVVVSTVFSPLTFAEEDTQNEENLQVEFQASEDETDNSESNSQVEGAVHCGMMAYETISGESNFLRELCNGENSVNEKARFNPIFSNEGFLGNEYWGLAESIEGASDLIFTEDTFPGVIIREVMPEDVVPYDPQRVEDNE